MKLIDLFTQHEKLTNEVNNSCRFCGYVDSQSQVKAEEEKFRRNHEKVLSDLKELDNLSNRIFEALATNYVEVRGVKLSLATVHHYIHNFKNATNQMFGGIDTCAIPSFHAGYSTARRRYYETLMFDIQISSDADFEGILVDPLKIKDKDRSECNSDDYLSDLKNAYIKAIAEIEVF